MPTHKEPGDEPADLNRDIDSGETLSLVDFFDRMDRAAFRRMLEDHDRPDSIVSRG